jgi:hypothetical protein
MPPTYHTPNQDFDLGDFRHRAAAFVKYLIRARCKAEPHFVDLGVLGHWGLLDISKDQRSIVELLQLALSTIQEINSHFLVRCGSGGIAPEKESPLFGLKWDVGFLADYQFSLPEAIKAARRGQGIAWDDVARWDTLPAIREGLDRLPQPQAKKDMAASGISWDEHSLTVWVGRTPYHIKDPTAFRIFTVLVEKAPSIVSTAQLQEQPGLRGKRPGLYVQRLPQPLQRCIRSKKGAGFFFRIPALTQRGRSRATTPRAQKRVSGKASQRARVRAAVRRPATHR